MKEEVAWEKLSALSVGWDTGVKEAVQIQQRERESERGHFTEVASSLPFIVFPEKPLFS